MLCHVFEIVVEINVKTIFPSDYVYIFYHLSEVVEMAFFAYSYLHRVSLVIEIVKVRVLGQSPELTT